MKALTSIAATYAARPDEQVVSDVLGGVVMSVTALLLFFWETFWQWLTKDLRTGETKRKRRKASRVFFGCHSCKVVAKYALSDGPKVSIANSGLIDHFHRRSIIIAWRTSATGLSSMRVAPAVQRI